jgi:hypothetical protein
VRHDLLDRLSQGRDQLFDVLAQLFVSIRAVSVQVVVG